LVACSNTSGRVGPTPLKNAPQTPVLFVHGYNAAACPGADVARAQWGLAYLELNRVGWRGPLLPVSYYTCDHDGVDITGYGPSVPSGAEPTISAGTPRVHYDQNTSIDQLAHDLAWFVYLTYARSGTPVDLVGISMGGLIIRDLLFRVARHDAGFPPKILVTHAVTFSTPYLGYGGQGSSSICPVATVECGQFAVGSPLLTELNAGGQLPQGEGGTSWAAAGSSAGCDFVPASSSLGITGALRIDYAKPCYTHPGYLYDADPDSDAAAKITRPDGSTSETDSAQHSLRWMLSAIVG
jgi:pimeloyl-ACP methyl ester carboxylesterase